MFKKKKSLGGCDKVSPVVPESDACLSLRSFVFFIYSSFLSFLCFTPVFPEKNGCVATNHALFLWYVSQWLKCSLYSCLANRGYI